MKRQLFMVVLVAALLTVVATAANAWPDFNAVTGNFSFGVSSAQTSTGWDYTVSVDPGNAYPGWGIKAFVVYASNVTALQSQSWDGYNGGNTAGWTNTGGGWQKNKYPGPNNTTAAFGWQTGSNLIMSGSSATFHAVNLPSGFQNWDQHFVVHAVPPSGDTFWTDGGDDNGGGGPPNETPEPGSLALLTLGAGAVFGALKRRKTS